MRPAVTQHLHMGEGSCSSLDELLFYCTAHFSQTMKINKEIHYTTIVLPSWISWESWRTDNDGRIRLRRHHTASLLPLTFAESTPNCFCANGALMAPVNPVSSLFCLFVCFSVPGIWFTTTNPQDFGGVELGESMFTCLNPHLIN